MHQKQRQLIDKKDKIKCRLATLKDRWKICLIQSRHYQLGVEDDNALIFEEVNLELEEYLARESGSNQDSTDSVSDLLSSISYSVQEEFDELISGENNKKTFSLGAIKNICTAPQHESRNHRKNRKNLKNCHKNDTQSVVRTKVTVRRLPDKRHQLPAWMVNKDYGTRGKTIYPFKIKNTLPERRTMIITKNVQKIKTINV